MKLQKFKERNKKQKVIIIFTIACVILITGVFLYKTFASFQVIKNEDMINGSIEDPGDIYFAFYKDNKIQKDMPTKEQGYVLDEKNSYCGVTGGNDSDIKVHITKNDMIFVEGVTTSRTKCNLYFVKGAYILGKGVPIVESDDGLYEVTHDDSTLDEKWKTIEYRYAGSNPDNYITFNNETWRIIGLVNVETSEGKVEQRVKIVRKDSIQNVQWNDSPYVNDWNKASLMKLLNTGDYYNREGDYETIGLTESAKEKIDDSILWNLGGVKYEDRQPVTNEIYKYERSSNVFEDNNYLWQTDNHGVALMYPSDYGYAVGGTNDNRTKCVIQTKLSAYNICTSENWLYLTNEYDFEWLLTHLAWKNPEDNYTFVFEIFKNVRNSGSVYGVIFDVSYNQHVSQFRPTLYLKTNVFITSGSGKDNDPYQIAQISK